jgi:hypothetical protein
LNVCDEAYGLSDYGGICELTKIISGMRLPRPATFSSTTMGTVTATSLRSGQEVQHFGFHHERRYRGEQRHDRRSPTPTRDVQCDRPEPNRHVSALGGWVQCAVGQRDGPDNGGRSSMDPRDPPPIRPGTRLSSPPPGVSFLLVIGGVDTGASEYYFKNNYRS